MVSEEQAPHPKEFPAQTPSKNKTIRSNVSHERYRNGRKAHLCAGCPELDLDHPRAAARITPIQCLRDSTRLLNLPFGIHNRDVPDQHRGTQPSQRQG